MHKSFRVGLWARRIPVFLLTFFLAACLHASPLVLIPPAQQGLEFLNNGHVLEAYDLLRKSHKESPDNTHILFLFAMTKLRIMTLSDYTPADKAELIDSVDHLESLCEQKMAEDDDALFFYSATQGLRAQLTGMEGDWWSTAKLGKKMKKTALELLERNHEYEEGYYLLGSYNYFADALPGYMKFLRALAFLPGGDRTEGMKQLIRAYQKPNVASIEAGRTLSYIYTYFEPHPDYGVQMCENVLTRCPDAFDIGMYKGIDLYFSSEFPKAEEWLNHVKAEIHAYSRTHGAKENEVVPVYLRLEREVRYWTARSLLRQKRLDEAEKILLQLKTPELHQPYWIQRGIFLSLAEIAYARKKPDQANALIAKVLQWPDVKDAHEKAKLLKKKKGNVDPFEIDFK